MVLPMVYGIHMQRPIAVSRTNTINAAYGSKSIYWNFTSKCHVETYVLEDTKNWPPNSDSYNYDSVSVGYTN